MSAIAAVVPVSASAQAAAADTCKTDHFYWNINNSVTNITAAKVKLAVRHCQDDDGLTPDSQATLDGEVTTAGNVLWGASLNHSQPRVEEGSPALYRFKGETDLETCLGWITPFCFHSKIDFYASYVVNASAAEADAISRNSDWEVERTGPF
ncbi:hypothetical protein ACFYXC_41245 [Streptomyces sp. NPDC002701]|uniref:hypothetical protein n=1 Tax=Streptomyces sp. NPDC002701 TaxID=3364661 RepID=UPI0036B2FE66